MTERPHDKTPLVLLTGGGTLGPVTPLLAIYDRVRQKKLPWRFVWVGTRFGLERDIVEKKGLPYVGIVSAKFSRYWDWQIILAPLALLVGFLQAYWLLIRSRPAVVVSVGGYVSVPVAWAAFVRGIPVIIHQQDRRRGLANALMWPIASLRTSVWEQPGAEVIGNIIRPEIYLGDKDVAYKQCHFTLELPIVLVIGGGTGALRLNRAVVEALPSLTDVSQVIHLTGQGKTLAAEAKNYFQSPFAGADLPNYFAAAQIVVTRAGMGTLSELAALQKAIIIVPMPHSHQEANARELQEKGAAVALDGQVRATELTAAVNDLLVDPGRRLTLGRALHEAIPDGSEVFLSRLAQVIEKS